MKLPSQISEKLMNSGETCENKIPGDQLLMTKGKASEIWKLEMKPVLV